MIPRMLSSRLMKLAKGFPVLSVTGPRQSGKTTLVRALFEAHAYLSLENLDVRQAAEEDPRRFLEPYKTRGVILDEVQRVPTLFSYLQEQVDTSGNMGGVVLTGSQNFLLLESITQSLAGRTAVEHLYPFTQAEVVELQPDTLDEVILKGSYPPLFDRELDPADFYPAYLETYVERDVRSIRNIGNLSLFRKFLMLCAGRTGQLLNLSALGNEVGVDYKTIQSWISVLEASFLIALLRPHHRNWNKRVVKQPKLYFLDTGVVCSLLGIRSAKELASHPLRGALFETYVISDAFKTFQHRGQRPPLTFWRDHGGREVDLLIESSGGLTAVEIKSGATASPAFFQHLERFQSFARDAVETSKVIYGGEESRPHRRADLVSWRELQW